MKSKQSKKRRPDHDNSTPNVRKEAARIIGRVLRDGAYANRLLDASLASHPWDPRDSGLLTELVYGVLRRVMSIDAILDGVANKGIDSIDPAVRVHLEVAVYQLMALDRVPDHAVISEAVALVRKQRGKAVSGFANALLRKLQREPERLVLAPEGLSTAEHLARTTSHPQWLVERLLQERGEEAAVSRLEANNQPAPHTLRINPHWGARDAWLQQAQELGMTATETPFAKAGVLLESGTGSLREWMAQHPTACTIQDEAAQLLGEWLDPQPGEVILDACAAPGGKTTHIASLAPEAQIVALDVHEHKVKLLRQSSRRFQLPNIVALQADATKTIPIPEGVSHYDRILCDAPCSGLGILRRQPEIRYRRKPEDLERLQALQRQLLDNLAPLVKPGGILLYSVCTDTQEETSQVIDSFLDAHPDFARAAHGPAETGWKPLLDDSGDLRTDPVAHNMDGFYAARLQKRSPQ